jgi:hypothetical protein
VLRRALPGVPVRLPLVVAAQDGEEEAMLVRELAAAAGLAA